MSDHPLDPEPRDGWRRLLTAHLRTHLRTHLTTHLRVGQIREYLDGEVRGLTALRYGLHLAICPRCAERRQSVKARGHAVATLLELAGTRTTRPRSRVVSVPAISFVAIAALSAATAGILVSYGPFARPRLVAQAQIKDVCCFDLSGGSNMNDGVVTVSRSGQVVDCVIVYEDRAKTRAFAAGDPLLFLSRKKECKEAGLRDAPGPGKFAAAPGT
jgi:hypothetical protein